MHITNLNQYKMGLSGLAFLRNWLAGDEKKNNAILRDMRAALNSAESQDSDTKVLEKYDVDTGYAKWAENYDQMPNLLIDAEEPVVKDVLRKLEIGRVADAACGTGRYSSILEKMGHTVVGIDQSKSMLQIARNKCIDAKFICSDISKMPLSDNSFDFAISALALTHLSNPEPSIKEIARIVKKSGTIVLSDIHPMIVALGGHADFQGKNGERGFITNYVHWHSKYLKAFRENNLEVIECLEPKLKPEHTQVLQQSFSLQDTTIHTALDGLPIALVWVLKKK